MSTILVIDDTTLARETVSKLLEYEGFRAMRAKNGREGGAMMYKDTPDLILRDLMMHEMDGITFLKMLRRSPLWKDMPVIVLTGMSFHSGLRRSIFRKVMPSISGIIRSSRIRSGVSLYIMAQPSRPFLARMARKPSYSNSFDTVSRARVVSSMTRMVDMRDTSVCAYVSAE